MKFQFTIKNLVLCYVFWISFLTNGLTQDCIISNAQINYNYHSGSNGSLFFQSIIGGVSQSGECNTLDYTSILLNADIVNQISNLSQDFGLKIFPNPVSNLMAIEWISRNFEIKYHIYNLDGEILKSNTIPAFQTRITLNINEFNSGFYFIRFTGPNAIQFSKKFLKI